MECNGCGKEMSNKEGENLVALHMSIDLNEVKPPIEELLKSSLGKYYKEGEQKYEWSFCYECWLDSLLM